MARITHVWCTSDDVRSLTVHILHRARHGVDQHVSAFNPSIPLDTELDEDEDPTISVYL